MKGCHYESYCFQITGDSFLCLSYLPVPWLRCATAVPAAKNASPAQPVLRVGVCANSPPIIFKQAGDYAGVEAELARGLGDALGMNIQFVDCPWNELIPALLDGKFDIIMSGMTITEQRSVRIAFTSPYLTAGQMCLVRNEIATAIPRQKPFNSRPCGWARERAPPATFSCSKI